jgi:hypothetical protein
MNSVEKMKTDLVDKNGEAIYVGDKLRTFDKTGKEWIGTVIVVQHHNILKGRDPQYALMTNYATWLHPEQMDKYEIVNRWRYHTTKLSNVRYSRKLDV